MSTWTDLIEKDTFRRREGFQTTSCGLFQFRHLDHRALAQHPNAHSAYVHADSFEDALYAASAVDAVSTVEVLGYWVKHSDFKLKKLLAVGVGSLVMGLLLFLLAESEERTLALLMVGTWHVWCWTRVVHFSDVGLPGLSVRWLHKRLPPERVRECEDRLDVEAMAEALE